MNPRRNNGGLEAFTGPDLSALIEGRGGVHIRTRGSHMTYVMPDGTEVQSLTKGNVPAVLARIVAKGLGMTYSELRATLGHPVIDRKKRPHKVARVELPTVTRADVIATLDALQADVAALNALRYGHRDAAFYAEALTPLADARRKLRRMPTPLATWEPPIEASA